MILALKEKGYFEDKSSNKLIVCGHCRSSCGHSKIEGKGSVHGADAVFTPFIAD